MTSAQRFYVLLRNGAGAALVNALLNGGIGWVMMRGLTEFPVWRVPGAAADFVVTAFGITFGTCVVLPFQVKRDFTAGRASLPEVSPGVRTLLARFPRAFLRRAVVLGAVSVPLFAPWALLALFLSGASELARIPFIELKALFSAIEGGIVTPFIVLAVLTDCSRQGAERTAALLSTETP